jgi:hypothetical protein
MRIAPALKSLMKPLLSEHVMHVDKTTTGSIVSSTRQYCAPHKSVKRAIADLLLSLGWSDLTGLRLLEIGCGTGCNLLEFLRFGFRPEHLQVYRTADAKRRAGSERADGRRADHARRCGPYTLPLTPALRSGARACWVEKGQ